MRRVVRVLLATALLWTGVSFAVEPAYVGPMGNYEEPAMRPYKWVWHGFRSMHYQFVTALERGNAKTPGLGTIHGLQGLRRGTVELGESAFEGVIFAQPPAAGSYRQTGTVNGIIDHDPFLRTVADCPAVSALCCLVDCYPYNTLDEQEKALDRAKALRQARKQSVAMTGALPDTPIVRALKAYLGDRAVTSKKKPFTGNILKQTRK